MPNAARCAVAPVYLFSCLILGGSTQGVWQNASLQLVGLLIIGRAVADNGGEPISGQGRRLLLIAMAGIGVVALQTLPLPPSLWAHGVRAPIAEGYRLLGMPVPWMSISISPYSSLATLLCVIPPLAMFIAVVRFDSYHPSWLAVALLTYLVTAIPLSPWPEEFPGHWLVESIISNAVALLLFVPISAGFWTLFYYSLRIESDRLTTADIVEIQSFGNL